jgi:hypothetical protein
MAVESFTKQSWEEWVIAGSIDDVIDTGETIVEATSDIKAWHWDDETTEKTTDLIEIATKAADNTNFWLKVRVKGGDATEVPEGGSNPGVYKITFYIITSLGNKYEIDVKMKIKES